MEEAEVKDLGEEEEREGEDSGGKEEMESRHSWSKRGTKARGMRDSRRATKVFIFPSSDGGAIRAMMILQTDGTVPIGDHSQSR